MNDPWSFRITVVLAVFLLSGLSWSMERPNVLWLTSEDNSIDWVGCYGNPHAETPNIDALAAEGFQYTRCFANAPVCAPLRSTWITGVLAISNGTFPMRSRYPIPHDEIAYYPDLLRENGYYVANDQKTDFNIGGRKDGDCWSQHGKVNWDDLKKNQPFFQVLNILESHESTAHGNVDETKHDPADIRLREYHPDLPGIRGSYAKYHDSVKRMDRVIGDHLLELKSKGLTESTIVIYCSDHGGVLPRSKRFLFGSGLHCPLVIRIPEKYRHLWPTEKPGSKVDRLVSFVDMPKTWLSLTGSEVPAVMQGLVFLGKGAEEQRKYHFAFRGRMDERVDNARAVTDGRYLLIRNYMPYVPWMQELSYLWKMKASTAWADHVASGKATERQARFFLPKGEVEELYDMEEDPDNIHNLIDDPKHMKEAARLRSALRQCQLEVFDAGLLPESEMSRRASKHGLTIHEMVRDPELYDLPALLDAADLALEMDEANILKLRELLRSPDEGLRYWGVVGCFLLNDGEVASRCLHDGSHEVRAMAAWLMVHTGRKKEGLRCLEEILKENSYATLTVLNMLDWIGGEAAELMPVVQELDVEGYEKSMKELLLKKAEGEAKRAPR